MESMKVRDVMVPSSAFPKIAASATLFETLSALESAQERYLSGQAEQRILLVEDDQGRIVGKVSPIDLLRGLETNYAELSTEDVVSRYGFDYIWKSMRSDFHLWEDPFRDLCGRADRVRVGDFAKLPARGHRVAPDDPLATCLHLFVMIRHDSLFVVDGDTVLGLLRFSDVYRLVSRSLHECARRLEQP
ncbi:MAG TPA: CBS domain-containing protein [Methylomirabilota bacterium]|nr:CBS domain-containing protein [Methylomirabilota bacterium]